MQKHQEVYDSTARMILMITANSESFTFKARIKRFSVAGNARDVEIVMPLIYLSNFW